MRRGDRAAGAALLRRRTAFAAVVDPRADFTPVPLWPKVPALAQGRLARLAPDTWTVGGPLSAQRLVERLTQALA